MLTTATHFKGLAIQAADGELGSVDELYFDDETWVIRYLTVDTGGWLGGRQVLISPISVIRTDWQARRLDVALTKKQVENTPDIDTHQPVSRQHHRVSGTRRLGPERRRRQPAVRLLRAGRGTGH